MRIPWALPFIDEKELIEASEAIRSNWLSMGKRVSKLENKLARYTGNPYAIAVSNGTVALDLALKVLEIGPEDEVILPAVSYISTLNVVVYQRATPVFADIEEESFTIDPSQIERKISPQTKCIITMDYSGFAADYLKIEQLAARTGIPVIQDGAQSLGGTYQGRPLCSQGKLSTTSFHIAKAMTTVEGGMVFCRDDKLAKKLKIMRNQGENPEHKYQHIMLGYNYRLSDLHAAIGLVQFRKLESILRKRAHIAELYEKMLHEAAIRGLRVFKGKPGNKPARFLFPILVPERDKLAQYLDQKGIETRICYSMALYEQPFCKKYEWSKNIYDCPVAEKLSRQVINLPVYHTLNEEQIQYIISCIKDFYR